MALFSQRQGLQPMQKPLQFESIDEQLRIRLWNALQITIWHNWSPEPDPGLIDPKAEVVESFIKTVWLDHFKQPIDIMPAFDERPGRSTPIQIIRQRFFRASYNEVYDFLEFTVQHLPSDWGKNLRNIVNRCLEEENAAYRFVDLEIVPITDQEEIAAVEEATSSEVLSAREHSRKALEFLSDRDYRNSIKESISAVEAAARFVTRNDKGDFTDCLKV